MGPECLELMFYKRSKSDQNGKLVMTNVTISESLGSLEALLSRIEDCIHVLLSKLS
jgi:hypothetical protein